MVKKKHNAEILLKALLTGLPVNMFGCVLSMDSAFNIYAKGKMLDGRDIPLNGYKITLSQFVQAAEKMSFDDVFLIGADIALNEMKGMKY